MDCKYFKDLLSTYIDGYLKEEEKKSIEEHLSFCKSCNDYFNKLKNYKEIFNKIEKIEVPLGFEKRVMGKIEGEKNKIFFLSKKFFFEFSAVLVVLLSVFLVYISLNKKEEYPKQVFEKKVLKREEKITKDSKEISQENKKIENQKKFFKAEEIQKDKNNLEILEKTAPLKIKEKVAEKPMMEVEKKEEAREKGSLIISKKPSFEKQVTESIQREEKVVEKPSNGTIATSASSPVARVEKKLKININYSKFNEIFKEIEEILKNENILYEKKQINEKFIEIKISFGDLQKILEKIKKIEGLRIEEIKGLNEKEKVTIEVSAF